MRMKMLAINWQYSSHRWRHVACSLRLARLETSGGGSRSLASLFLCTCAMCQVTFFSETFFMLHFIHHFSIVCLNFGHHFSSHIGAFTLNFKQRGAITFVVNHQRATISWCTVLLVYCRWLRSSEKEQWGQNIDPGRGLGTATSLSLVSGQMVLLRPASASAKQIRAEAEAEDADGTLIVGKWPGHL